MRGKIKPEDVRLVAAFPQATAKAARLRRLAKEPGGSVVWHLSNAEALALAEVLDQSDDVAISVLAHIRAQDEIINAAQLRVASVHCRQERFFRRRESLVLWISAGVIAALAHYALSQVAQFLLTVMVTG